MTCIVYSASRVVAERKLQEIARDNNTVVVQSHYDMHVVTDADYWMWVNPENDIARGYCSYKAFVDTRCSIKTLHYIIMPGFRGSSDDMRFFE